MRISSVFFTTLLCVVYGMTLCSRSSYVHAKPFQQLASSNSTDESVILTVAFCPTDATSAGAVVKVDPNTGNFGVIGTFPFPKEIFGMLTYVCIHA
jgi:hypothetical protein